MALDKLSTAGDKAKRTGRLEVHAQKATGKAPGKAQKESRPDKTPALPQKGGAPDRELYATFPEKSLRRRLWDAVSTKKCVRCNGDHLRSACSKERQTWEDDFERSDFWTKKFTPPKQARVQLAPHVNRPCLQVLHIICSAGLCLIDTCSDVSMARRDGLTSVRRGETAVVIAHLGGETTLQQEVGTLTLEVGSAVLCNVFAVRTEDLPAGVVALIGVADARRLGLSLDRIAAHPGCRLQDARPSSCTGRLASGIRSFASRVTRFFCGRAKTLAPVVPPVDDFGIALAVDAQPAMLPAPREDEREERYDFVELFRPILSGIKLRHKQEQQARTRTRIAILVATQSANLASVSHQRSRFGQSSSSTSHPMHRSPRPPSPESFESMLPRRRGAKFYGVRIGRQVGVFDSWDECRAMVDGVSNSEFRSFTSRQAAHYVSTGMMNRQANMMMIAPAEVPTISFRGGRALRAFVHVLQEGETHTHECLCRLDSGADVNMAKRHLLHDVRTIEPQGVSNCGDATSFNEEGVLKLLISGEIRCVPALVATKEQLPHKCLVLMGVPRLDDLGIQLDEHRGKDTKPLECFVGEKTLRTWLEAWSHRGG